ncbi:MAG: hypothetical protein JSS87_11815 [Acidobacteria bacterium]|nr:hypothetical protein [Acidobacteriota bacterium]
MMCLATACLAQVRPDIPPTAPTSATPSRRELPPSSYSQRAIVTWEAGRLKIVAQNSSLNSILRDVALKTGMKIVGAVQDERVFGTYGPDIAAKVLAQLMEGTRCNMALESDTAHLPMMLTLTPLTGGVTPPNPMQVHEEQEAPPPADIDQPLQQPQPTTPQPGTPISGGVNTNGGNSGNSNNGTTDQQSPNGVRTPQQVFEQLQKMHQRQGVTP